MRMTQSIPHPENGKIHHKSRKVFIFRLLRCMNWWKILRQTNQYNRIDQFSDSINLKENVQPVFALFIIFPTILFQRKNVNQPNRMEKVNSVDSNVETKWNMEDKGMLSMSYFQVAFEIENSFYQRDNKRNQLNWLNNNIFLSRRVDDTIFDEWTSLNITHRVIVRSTFILISFIHCSCCFRRFRFLSSFACSKSLVLITTIPFVFSLVVFRFLLYCCFLITPKQSLATASVQFLVRFMCLFFI